MAAEGVVIVKYIFTGEEERHENGGYIIPRNVTHLLFHESVTVIPGYLFYKHPNIVELICHLGVKKIESNAFCYYHRLKSLIIPGVEVVEDAAFYDCQAVSYVECPKLEGIGIQAFGECKSLSNIKLPSAKIVEACAYWGCEALTEAKFGKQLESIGSVAFNKCASLESITIPLKNGLFTNDDIFKKCGNLKQVDLVEGEVLRGIAEALQLEEWRNDMKEEVDSINQILPNTSAGVTNFYDTGEKAMAVRDWITRLLRKIIYYKAEHRRLLNEAASTLHLTLPNDLVTNKVLPFLELPSYTFDGEHQEQDDNDDEEENDSNIDDSSDETNNSESGEDDHIGGDDDDEEDEGEEDEDDNDVEFEEQDAR